MNEIQEYNEKELVSERRKEQFEMRLRGIKRGKIVEELSTKYDVAPTTIDQDWQRKSDWWLDVIGINDASGLVVTTIGSFNLSQDFRKQLFEGLLGLANKISPDKDDDDTLTLDELEALPAVWGIMMKLLNDMDAAEKTKSDILTKLGILKEAPKKVEVRETRVEHKLDWAKFTEGLDDETRRKFFDEIGGINTSGAIDIEGGEE